MNVSDAVRQRRSIRDFRADPVPQELLADILDTARWAPSGSNIQAWRIIAVAGAERDAVVQITRKAPASAGFGKTDDPYPIYPPELWEPLRTRRYTLAEDMYRALGIPREDKPARFQHVARNFEFFGAPVGLFFVIDQRVVHRQRKRVLSIGSVQRQDQERIATLCKNFSGGHDIRGVGIRSVRIML